MIVVGHHAIVQDDRYDWNFATDGGFDIQSCHTEGGIAHHIDDLFFRRGDFGADGQSEAIT